MKIKLKLVIVIATLIPLLTITKAHAGSAWSQKLISLAKEQGWVVSSNYPGYTICAVSKPTQDQIDNLVSTICSEWGSDYPSTYNCKMEILNRVDDYSNNRCEDDDLEIITLSDGSKLAKVKGKGVFEDEIKATASNKNIISIYDDSSYCLNNNDLTELQTYALNKICTNEDPNNALTILCKEELNNFLSFESIKSCDDIDTEENLNSNYDETGNKTETIKATDFAGNIFSKILNYVKNLFSNFGNK